MLEGGEPGGYTYSLSPAGRLKRLHGFRRIFTQPSARMFGTNPEGGLSVGQDGAIYGSTRGGGVFGHGVLFKFHPREGLRVLHHFEVHSYRKGPVLAAENGDVYASLQGDHEDLLRLAKDGSQTRISVPGAVTSIAETAGHEIIVGSIISGNPPSGPLWRVTSAGGVEKVADVGYLPTKIVPLANGDVLCTTPTRIVEVSMAGQVSVVHEFGPNWDPAYPTFLTVAQDGSYLGSTWKGGSNDGGVAFRIVPGANSYSVLSELPSSARRGYGREWMEEVFPLRVGVEGGNRPPMARDDFVDAKTLKAGPGGLPQGVIRVLKNDADADSDPLTIVSVSTPQHGTAEFDFVEQTITYTANSAAVESDTFTYTIVDGSGGRSTGHVFIRASVAGRYSGAVIRPPSPGASGPPITEGKLSVRILPSRVAVGRLELEGKTYRLAGRFNEVNQMADVLQSNARVGKMLGLQLWLRPNGGKWTVEATIRKNGEPFSATCPVEE